MHQRAVRPTFAPRVLCVRGVYEVPWFLADRQSVMLVGVDSAGCMVGWAAIRDAQGYAAESDRLAALLDTVDPLTPASFAGPRPPLRLEG